MTEQGSSIGARLRATREQAGVTLRQIADTTKLSVSLLEALERDRISVLPGGIYRRAIVRAYAREVGLDPEVTLRAFLERYPDDLPAPRPPPPKKSTYDPLPTCVEAPVRPRRLATLLSVLGALVPIAAGLVYFSIGVRGADGPRRAADMMPPTADARQRGIVPAGGFREAPAVTAKPVALLITVSSRCELQVIADGRQVVARQLDPGELLQLDLSDEVVLSGNNAGAVHFSINGRAGRQLGPAGTPLNVRIGREDYDAWLVPLN